MTATTPNATEGQAPPKGRYRLAHIEVRNFKRFEHLALDLEDFDLLVGPNNSGKSTVLEACRLFDFCYRSCLRGDNGTLHFARSVQVTAAQLPVAGELWRWSEITNVPALNIDATLNEPP